MSRFPQLKTQRLVLREIVAADAAAIFAIHGNVDVMRYFGADPMSEPAQAYDLIETFARWRDEENSGIRWGIEHQGQLIGTCGLFHWNLAWHSAMVGYELAHPSWGQGFMQEALAAILPYGFTVMDLNRIEAKIHPENTPSLKLMPKLGFAHEGQLREVGFWGGQFHDLVQFSLLKRDFC